MAEREIKVKGTALRYVDYDGNWREEVGVDTGVNGTVGELYIKGDHIRYIDSNGDERQLPFENIGGARDAGLTAVKSTNWIRYGSNAGVAKEWHTATAYGDEAHRDHTVYADDHTDHYDSEYSDGGPGWTDHTVYADDHSDTGHSDDPPHTDDHSNTPHNDHTVYADDGGWGDAPFPYTDHSQWINIPHADTGHSDDPPHTDNHSDTTWPDAPFPYTDHSQWSNHSDITWPDAPFPYTDHSQWVDIPHTDTPHTDEPHLV